MQIRPLLITRIPRDCLRISRLARQGALTVQTRVLFWEPGDAQPSTEMQVKHRRLNVLLPGATKCPGPQAAPGGSRATPPVPRSHPGSAVRS